MFLYVIFPFESNSFLGPEPGIWELETMPRTPFLYFKLSPSFHTLTVNATLLKGTYPSLTPFLVSCYILESTTDCSGGEELSLLGAFPFPFPDLRV